MNTGTTSDILHKDGTRNAGRMSLRDQAYEAIKRHIITCDLKPGEVVSAAGLSALFSLGRTPVNQAIDRLMTDGLVEVMPRKGIVVKPISLDEIMEIIEIRLINEVHCVRRAAAQADAETVERLRRNVESTAAAARARDVPEMMKLDGAFHAMLSAAARNGILHEFLRNLHDRSARLWFISLRAESHHLRVCEQHRVIVEAIARRDADAAGAAIRHHIEDFRANLTRQL